VEALSSCVLSCVLSATSGALGSDLGWTLCFFFFIGERLGVDALFSAPASLLVIMVAMIHLIVISLVYYR
jgi:hypothetical protein